MLHYHKANGTMQDVNIYPLKCHLLSETAARCSVFCLRLTDVSAHLSLQFCHLTLSACTVNMRALFFSFFFFKRQSDLNSLL